MKKNLLFTTALVVVGAMPAFAAEYTTRVTDSVGTAAEALTINVNNEYGVFIKSGADETKNASIKGSEINITASGVTGGNQVNAVHVRAGELIIEGGKVNINVTDIGEGNLGGIGISSSTINTTDTRPSTVTVKADSLTINSQIGGINAHNRTTEATGETSKIDITANTIDITADEYAVSAMSQGKVTIEGNTTLKAPNAIVSRGFAEVKINETGTNMVKMDGNIDFDYDELTSGSTVDATVKVVLDGENSQWNGNAVTMYETVKGNYSSAADLLKIEGDYGAYITLQNGAVWNATAIKEELGEKEGQFNVALNTLTINNGIVNVDTGKQEGGVSARNTNAKDATFTGDKFNAGKMTVSGLLNVEGSKGIVADTIAFESGSSLKTKFESAASTSILEATSISGNTTLVIESGSTGGQFQFTGNQSDFSFAENTMYDIVGTEKEGSVLYQVSQKETSSIAENLGATSSEANAVMAVVNGGTNTDNAAFNEVAEAITTAAQTGDKSVAKEAAKLGADAAPVVQSVETATQNTLFTLVTAALNNASGAIAQGRSSGDTFENVSAWIRGMFNRADKETTSKSSGFTSDSYGIAFGLDKQINNAMKVGFGYGYTESDIDGVNRDTDVDTNTLFIYNEYKPANWYIRTMLSYSWSEYDEKKSVMGANAGSDYDVDTIGIQSMYGYETVYKGYDVTPEVGLRYAHISQDSYTNALGSTVGSNDADILTAVAGVKVAKDYDLNPCTTIRPTLRAAVTYDIFDGDDTANVLLANGASYQVNGESLERLGFEFGVDVATDVNDNLELSAGYEARLRKDYQDHTLLLNAKYEF